MTHKNTRTYKHKYQTSGVGDPVLLVQYSERGGTFKYKYKQNTNTNTNTPEIPIRGVGDPVQY